MIEPMTENEEYAAAQSRAFIAEHSQPLIREAKRFLEDYAASEHPQIRVAKIMVENILRDLECFDLVLGHLQDRTEPAIEIQHG